MSQNQGLFCKHCSKNVKDYIKCYDCGSIYHPACFEKLPNAFLEPNKPICCKDNITSLIMDFATIMKINSNKDVLKTKNEMVCDENKFVEVIKKKSVGGGSLKKIVKEDNNPKRFKLLSVLRQHELSHQNVKKYKCAICSKRFKRLAEIYYHSRRHSSNNEKRLSLKVII